MHILYIINEYLTSDYNYFWQAMGTYNSPSNFPSTITMAMRRENHKKLRSIQNLKVKYVQSIWNNVVIGNYLKYYLLYFGKFFYWSCPTKVHLKVTTYNYENLRYIISIHF